MSTGGDGSKRIVILAADVEDDVRLRDCLAKHLAPWAPAGKAEVWHEGRIQGGDRLTMLNENVARADAIVALLTSDLIADEARWSLLEGARARGARVVPVIARACLWEATSLGGVAVLPANKMTVAMLSDPGEAWNKVAAALGAFWSDAANGTVEVDREAPRPPNNLPPRRLFVGRRKDLAAVHERLTTAGAASITQRATVFGLGGVGKTSLAIEYAHAHANEYPGGLYWVRAEGDPMRALLAFSAELGPIAPPVVAAVLARAPQNDAEAIAAGVRLALQANERRSLLVLDNVDADWSAHVPGGSVHVLVTTREPERAIGGDRSRVRLDVLERADALALADEITGGCAADDGAARDRVVMDALGALAVAVDMAARAVRKWTKTWSRYEVELTKQDTALLEDARLYGEAYRRGAFAAIDLSLERCTDPTAHALLESLATLAPESAPMEWAEAGAGVESGRLDAARAWEALVDGGFVRLDPTERWVTLHRLVHRRRAATTTHEGRTARAAAMAAFVSAWLAEAVDPGRIPIVEARVPHVEALLGALESESHGFAWIAMANRLAQHLWHRGSYPAARDLSQRALDVAERLVPPDEGGVATQLSNLAMALHGLGDATGARPLLERALHIDEKIRGANHLNIAIDLSNLAVVLRDLDDATGARPLLERALRINEKARGPRHPHVAICLCNLAMVLRDLGDAAGARPLLERALRIDEKARGTEHPNVAAHLSNLATVLRDLGDAAGARPLLERALRIDEKALGTEHPSVAIRLSALATVLHDLGDAAGARPLLERAFAIAERRLGAEHPRTQGFRRNLAALGPRNAGN